MRRFALFLMIPGFVFSQSLVEFGSAAAVGTVGGASGKRVSEGVTTLLGKVNSTMEKSAATDKDKERTKDAAAIPVMRVSRGVPKEAGPDLSGVPAPPPPRGAVRVVPVVTQAELEIPAFISEFNQPLPVLPPPPTMSREGLEKVGQGTTRSELLHLGAPSSKITTFEDGHLVETYSYRQNGQKFGTVRLQDGAVASVSVQ